MDNDINEFNDLNDEDYFDTITMTDENGVESEFFVVDCAELDNNKYLLVVAAEDFEEDEPDAFILKEVNTDGEDAIYELLEDGEEYNKVVILLQDNESDYDMQF